ncbi:hypothetical protein GALMADRAFT_252952 [Galerina marginata CBS 339.88]|uniref:Aminoglycoside phosphotransferase domain-containing protein n=1 Tax=Galerina marginata (strain CBS 339.88) TaxID=685588 RepID=A0A067SP53_GALM3|nr:hypothetical protein GALMADRAFT_252952 [Galerina marginata CBS 339.88]
MANRQMHWKVGATQTRPLWTTVPDVSVVEALSRPHLFPHGDNLTGELTVTFLAEGAFNKVYTVDVKSTSLVKSFVFRASLPVEPGDKVRNEAATMMYIKQHTKIPVPAVIAYDCSSENALGFEWILMERIPGAQLSEIWPSLSDTAKSSITREIGDYIVQMRRNCVFHEIGGLYHDADRGFTIGPTISQFFFMGPRRQLISRNRGPYEHDRDFARALVDVQIADIQFLNTIQSTDPIFDPDLFDDGPDILHAMDELHSLIPLIFPKDETNERFRTILQHPDLSLHNIMVDPTTLNITGLIDWECTNASPHWEHPYPQFLMGPEVEDEPPRVEHGDTDPLRNEQWDDWEKMHLRKVFDEVAGHLVEEPLAVLKREFMYHLGVAEYSQVMVTQWAKTAREQLAAFARE